MRHSLDLLHQLLFPDVPVSKESDDLNTDFDLRYKLHTAPHVVFNGLAHMFTVMIGRLSYADPPDWLSVDMHSDIEKMTGKIDAELFLSAPLPPCRASEGPYGLNH